MELVQELVSRKQVMNMRACCSIRNYFQMKSHSWMGLELVNTKVLGSIRSCFQMKSHSWMELELGLSCKNQRKDMKMPGLNRKMNRCWFLR
jgi:hypothetical protein